MVNLKFQEATTRTPIGTDIFPFIRDPTGTPLDGKTQFDAVPLNILGTPTADLAMGSNKITGLTDGTAAQDAVTKSQLDGKVTKGGDTDGADLIIGTNDANEVFIKDNNTNTVRIEGGKLRVGDVSAVPSVTLHPHSGGANTTPIVQTENNVGDSRTFITGASPESVISGSPGDVAIDVTNGKLYVHDNTTGITGWVDQSAGGGGGEANTASNVGTGSGLFKQKSGVDLEFNSIIGGTGITITDTTDDFTISHDAHTGDVTGATALTLSATKDVVGTHHIFIPALSMYPATTNPCSDHTKSELATNDVDIFTLDFAGATTNEIAKFDWIPPENWDAGTVNIKYYWTGATGAGTVEFETSAVAIGNDDALDVAFGTAVAVTDTFITADDMHVTPQSGDITIGGTPANADWVQFKVLRDQATDTKAEDAKLIGAVLEYTIDAATSSG